MLVASSSVVTAILERPAAAQRHEKRVLVLSDIWIGWDVQPIFERTLHTRSWRACRRARKTHVLVSRDAEGIQLRITDDGCGFNIAEREPGGMGLMSMRERVRLMRGQVLIDSSPGRGTRICVSIPLPCTSALEQTTPTAPSEPVHAVAQS